MIIAVTMLYGKQKNEKENHLNFCLLLGFCWAGGAAPPHAPASFAAGRSLVPVSPAGCLDAGEFLSQIVQERPERTLSYNSEQFYLFEKIKNTFCIPELIGGLSGADFEYFFGLRESPSPD